VAARRRAHKQLESTKGRRTLVISVPPAARTARGRYPSSHRSARGQSAAPICKHTTTRHARKHSTHERLRTRGCRTEAALPQPLSALMGAIQLPPALLWQKRHTLTQSVHRHLRCSDSRHAAQCGSIYNRVNTGVHRMEVHAPRPRRQCCRRTTSAYPPAGPSRPPFSVALHVANSARRSNSFA
jgi:hypothetical protein